MTPPISASPRHRVSQSPRLPNKLLAGEHLCRSAHPCTTNSLNLLTLTATYGGTLLAKSCLPPSLFAHQESEL